MTLQLIQQTQMGLNQAALDEWIEYRRAVGKKMTQLSVDKVIKKMLHWNEADQQRLVDEAIEREWTSLNWVDPPKQQTTRDTTLEDDLINKDWAR